LDLIEKCEKIDYTIESADKNIKDIKIKNDPVKIVEYIEHRLKNNDILKIIAMENQNIPPSVYVHLHSCQPTSISVERAFSMLKNLNTNDRNFLDNNLEQYIILYYNNK